MNIVLFYVDMHHFLFSANFFFIKSVNLIVNLIHLDLFMISKLFNIFFYEHILLDYKKLSQIVVLIIIYFKFFSLNSSQK